VVHHADGEAPRNDREAILANATRLRESGLYADALAQYARVVGQTPDDPQHADVYALIGDTYQEQGNLVGAAGAYKQAVQLNSTPEYCEKYDAALDAMHGGAVSTPPKPNPKPAPIAAARPGMVPAVSVVCAPEPRAEEEERDERDERLLTFILRLVARWRNGLTPEIARAIIIICAAIILISTLLSAHPWQRQKKVAPIMFVVPGRPQHLDVQVQPAPAAPATTPATPTPTTPAPVAAPGTPETAPASTAPTVPTAGNPGNPGKPWAPGGH
jgi:tetratricopeptide (TPR) repeat protein